MLFKKKNILTFKSFKSSNSLFANNLVCSSIIKEKKITLQAYRLVEHGQDVRYPNICTKSLASSPHFPLERFKIIQWEKQIQIFFYLKRNKKLQLHIIIYQKFKLEKQATIQRNIKIDCFELILQRKVRIVINGENLQYLFFSVPVSVSKLPSL